ncbi:MAG: hypothetical protein NWF08_10050 [Candidatus Bathyarchaeota archaeon]|nr:hypothetical protein [Candidatus Bathyarchaeota archaeon]
MSIENPSSPRMCSYHHNLPATYICSQCSRSICRSDVRFYGDISLCPQCYAGMHMITEASPSTAHISYPPYPKHFTSPLFTSPIISLPFPSLGSGFLPPRARPVWGFLLALISGIVAIIAGAGATTVLYANLALVPAWLVDYWMIPLGIGILLGLVVILGAFLVWQGYSTLGGILAFIFALANIYLAILIVVPVMMMYVPIVIGIAAVVLGLIAGLLGILS